MIRWASVGLVIAFGGVAAAQNADVIRELNELTGRAAPVQVAPFGGVRNALQPIRIVPNPPPGGLEPVPRQPPARPIRPSAPTLAPTTKLDPFGDPLPAGAVARYGTVRLRHGGEPAGLVFTPDGKYLASVGQTEDSIRLWDPVSGKELYRLETPLTAAAFARDGTVVIVNAEKCKVWQPATNTTRDLPEGTLPENAVCVAVHPDNRTFAAGTQHKIAVIDLVTGKARGEYKVPGDQPPIRLSYSPDGRWLAGTGQKAGVWLWDVKTGKRVRTYQAPIDVCEFAFSPDSKRLAIAADVLRVFSTDSEEVDDGYAPPEGQLFAPRFGPDGKSVFGMTPEGSVVRLDSETGEQKDSWEPPEGLTVRMPAALSPDGSRAAAIDPSGGIRIWQPRTGKGPEVQRLPILFDPGLAADGKTASCLDMANKVHVFDSLTGKVVKVIELPLNESIQASYDPRTGRVVAIVGEELEIQVIDVASGKVLAKLPGSNTEASSTVFHPTDKDKVAVLTSGSVAVYSIATGKAVRSFAVRQTEGATPHGCFSPDGRLIALTTDTLSVWEVATGKRRFEIDAVQNPAGVSFSPDGRLLAAWDGADSVVVFDVRTGTVQRRFQLPGADGSINVAAFTPDSKRLVTGGRDGLILFWDAATGEAALILDRHDGMVTGLAFSADGNRLISTAGDGTALVWDLSGKPAVKVAAPVGGADEAVRLIAVADAVQAQRGIEYLYRNPVEAVKALGEKVPVPAATSAETIAAAVAALKSEDFQTRQRAERDLEAIGPEAVPTVREAAEKGATPEVRKLAAAVLAKLEGPPTRADDLRALRAVEVLEFLGTPPARDILKKWASGPAGARLTTEASAALERLKK